LAGHKGIKFEGGIRVPFLMRWPQKVKEGRVYDKMVSSMDIFPTSLAAAGGETQSADLDGCDLVPYVTGEKTGVPHQELYWHKLWFSAMRDGSWKLIYVKDYGYALYDLSTDPTEANDLAKQSPERVDAMSRRLNDWKAKMEPPRWGEAIRWFHTHYRNHVRIIEGS
ncbi:MAG: sulfatase/phosphatase domain-containing protein, partial [Planctomycetota bacterium]